MKVLVNIKLSPHKYKTSEGYLICEDAILSRTGKQKYMKSEVFPEEESDEIIEVDRPEKEVFDKATMASFEQKPICIEHPEENVGPENYADLAVGHAYNIHRGKVEGKDVMLGDLMITDQYAIEDIENDVRTDLSCGYDCDIAKDANGNYYQTNIRGNHIALCEQGRAGIARIQDSWKRPIDDMVEDALKPEEVEQFVDEDAYVENKDGIWFAKPKGVKENFDIAYASNDEGKTWWKMHIEYKKDAPSGHTQENKALFRTTSSFPGGRTSIGRNVLTWYVNNNVHKIVEGDQIDHINEIYTDDRLENLQKLSASENNKKGSLFRNFLKEKNVTREEYIKNKNLQNQWVNYYKQTYSITDSFDYDKEVYQDIFDTLSSGANLDMKDNIKKVLSKYNITLNSIRVEPNYIIFHWSINDYKGFSDINLRPSLYRHDLVRVSEDLAHAVFKFKKANIHDAISKGSLIQEFGKQGKQYKIIKIVGNVIYAESLETNKTVLFKKDEENIEWATITKAEVRDGIYFNSKFSEKFEKEIKDFVDKLGPIEDVRFEYSSGYISNEHKSWVIIVPYNSEYDNPDTEGYYDSSSEDRALDKLKEEFTKAGYKSFIQNDYGHIKVYEKSKVKDAESVISEEEAEKLCKNYLDKQWRDMEYQKPLMFGIIDYAKKILNRDISMEDGGVLMKKMREIYKPYIKELEYNTPFEFTVNFSNSFGRDGKHRYNDLKSAFDAAVEYTRECSHDGKFGGGDILIYSHEKGGGLLAGSIRISSKFSGKRYSNGYAIPVDSDEYDINKTINNEKYNDVMRELLDTVEPGVEILTQKERMKKIMNKDSIYGDDDQFNVFVEDIEEKDAKLYANTYGLKYRKSDNGFVFSGEEEQIEEMLKDLIGQWEKIGRIMNEGWYSIVEDSIKDAESKRYHPNDFSDLFTKEEIEDFLAHEEENKDTDSVSGNKERHKKVFVDREERDKFVAKLPDEADARIDEFDHTFADDRYLVFWEVYYWDKHNVFDAKPVKANTYKLEIIKNRLQENKDMGTLSSDVTHSFESKNQSYSTYEDAKNRVDIILGSDLKLKKTDNSYEYIDIYLKSYDDKGILVDSKKFSTYDINDVPQRIIKSHKEEIKDAWFYTKNGNSYNGKLEDLDFEELVLRMKKRGEAINTIRLAPNGRFVTIAIFGHGDVEKPRSLYVDVIEEDEDGENQDRIYLKDFNTYEELIEGMNAWRKEYLSKIVESEFKDAANLDTRIIEVIKKVLGDDVKIDFGMRGQNIVIRYSNKVSPYMAKANLQRVIKALEDLGIKVDRRMTEKNSNTYAIEIWHNSNLSNGDIRQWKDSDESRSSDFYKNAIKHLQRSLHRMNEQVSEKIDEYKENIEGDDND